MLITVCVTIGAGLGVLLLSGNQVEAALVIESTPSGATVAINGAPLETPTPARYSGVEPGKRYEIYVSQQGFVPWAEGVIIPIEGGEVRVSASLQRVRVSVEVSSDPPGAQIKLNGATYGSTPRLVEDLDPDVDYTLELRLKGYKPHVQKLRWDGDETKLRVDVTLNK